MPFVAEGFHEIFYLILCAYTKPMFNLQVPFYTFFGVQRLVFSSYEQITADIKSQGGIIVEQIRLSADPAFKVVIEPAGGNSTLCVSVSAYPSVYIWNSPHWVFKCRHLKRL